MSGDPEGSPAAQSPIHTEACRRDSAALPGLTPATVLGRPAPLLLPDETAGNPEKRLKTQRGELFVLSSSGSPAGGSPARPAVQLQPLAPLRTKAEQQPLKINVFAWPGSPLVLPPATGGGLHTVLSYPAPAAEPMETDSGPSTLSPAFHRSNTHQAVLHQKSRLGKASGAESLTESMERAELRGAPLPNSAPGAHDGNGPSSIFRQPGPAVPRAESGRRGLLGALKGALGLGTAASIAR